jgi:hypothetical protein
VLVTVGTGEAVDGAGAGAVVGGARVGLGAGAGACVVGRGAGWAAACVVCCAPGCGADCVAERALAPRRAFLPCCTVAWGEAAGLADSAGAGVWTLAAGAGAVRAKTIANPTVASAPS